MNAYEYILDITFIEFYSLYQNANVANLGETHPLRTVLDSSARKAMILKPSIRRTKLKISSDKRSCWNRRNEAVLTHCIMKLHIVLDDHETYFFPLPPRKRIYSGVC